MFGVERFAHFRLLIGGQFEMFSQFLGPLRRIWWAMMPATIILLRGWLIVGGGAILRRHESRGNRDRAARDENKHISLQHGELLNLRESTQRSMNGILNGGLCPKIGFRQSLHNFTNVAGPAPYCNADWVSFTAQYGFVDPPVTP